MLRRSFISLLSALPLAGCGKKPEEPLESCDYDFNVPSINYVWDSQGRLYVLSEGETSIGEFTVLNFMGLVLESPHVS